MTLLVKSPSIVLCVYVGATCHPKLSDRRCQLIDNATIARQVRMVRFVVVVRMLTGGSVCIGCNSLLMAESGCKVLLSQKPSVIGNQLYHKLKSMLAV